jgi:hypothetical protein
MKSPARWLTVAAVAWAAVVSGSLIYLTFTWQQSAGSGSNSGLTMYESDGLTPIAVFLAPFVWILVTAGVAWAASRYRSFALSVLAGVLALILGTLCALTILAVFTPIPFIGIAFGLSVVLLLVGIFMERVQINTEINHQKSTELPPPVASQFTPLPSTPTAP